MRIEDAKATRKRSASPFFLTSLKSNSEEADNVYRFPLVSMPVESNADWLQSAITIQNRLGLHARPAMAFVDVANGFGADVRVLKGNQEVDGKSIMQMMMLAATKGTQLLVRAKGEDAQPALDALRQLVDRKFDEE